MVLIVSKEPDASLKQEDSAVLHRHLDHQFIPLEKSAGNYLFTEDGRKLYDGSGGPSVACIGWANERVIDAVTKQLRSAPYCATIFYTSRVAEELGRFLVDTTKGHMARAYIVNSGMSQCWLQMASADMLQAPRLWKLPSSWRASISWRRAVPSRSGHASLLADNPTTAPPSEPWRLEATRTGAHSSSRF